MDGVPPKLIHNGPLPWCCPAKRGQNLGGPSGVRNPQGANDEERHLWLLTKACARQSSRSKKRQICAQPGSGPHETPTSEPRGTASRLKPMKNLKSFRQNETFRHIKTHAKAVAAAGLCNLGFGAGSCCSWGRRISVADM